MDKWENINLDEKFINEAEMIETKSGLKPNNYIKKSNFKLFRRRIERIRYSKSDKVISFLLFIVIFSIITSIGIFLTHG